MLDAHQLNVFLVAAETLNFTETAKRLNMTQPSISQHIKAMEQDFDCKLFNRNGRRLELTDAGERLLPLARAMINQSILIRETMESLKGDVYGHLLVGCATTPGKYLLAPLLARFHERFPQVTIRCDTFTPDQAVNLLEDGTVHFILSSWKAEEQKQILTKHLVDDTVILIAPPGHAWSGSQGIEPTQLLTEKFILREAGAGSYQAVQKALHRSGIQMDQLNTIVTMSSSEAIALAVQEGLGVGFVSKTVLQNLILKGISTVEIKGMKMQQPVYMGCQTRRSASTAQVAFWKFALEYEWKKAAL